MEVYLDLLHEYGKETNNKDIQNGLDEYIHLKKKVHFMKLGKHPYRINYPENWSLPCPYDLHWQQLVMRRIQNVPYKRISHFREHLSRLQFTQTIDIPRRVLNIVKKTLTENEKSNWDIYSKIRENLKKEEMTRYNEHIHYMTSQITRKFIEITYEDHHIMFQLFVELEHEFCKDQRNRPEKRKNMISYYLIIQLVLYLFHYHPSYKLPTIGDPKKREILYCELLHLFTKTPSYQQIIFIHFKRKKDCYFCHHHDHEHHFDDYIVKLL